MNRPQWSLNLVCQELQAHIREMEERPDTRGQITMMRGALTLIAAVYDGMTNTEREAKVAEALAFLQGHV